MKNRKLNIKKIEESAERLGFNKSKLANIVDVSRETISQWFKGEKFPRPDKLLKLSLALGMNFNDIVINLPTENEPIVAFRKKGNHKITEQYLEEARDTGRMLSKLIPYLPFDELSRPKTLKQPRLDYLYIQQVAESIRNQLGKSLRETIKSEDIITFFNNLNAVIIPVLWGSKDRHENALHIYLPESMTTWIYLNLDCNIHDFKFWMAHELGHVLAPDLHNDEGEDFADAFAGALLVSEEIAAIEYPYLRKTDKISHQITHIKLVAERLCVSPLTVYFEINKYAEQCNLPKIDLEHNQEIYRANTNFNKLYKTVSECLFEGNAPDPSEYIRSTTEQFGSPFYSSLKEYIKEISKLCSEYPQNVLA
ncbi:MAG: Helix-turn-helix domain protein [Smithella sp. PtaU1.Bin162]|nr:MAG: Helix-turn-helix domain protein [Smithella sp. PtaU1.Bin162]